MISEGGRCSGCASLFGVAMSALLEALEVAHDLAVRDRRQLAEAEPGLAPVAAVGSERQRAELLLRRLGDHAGVDAGVEVEAEHSRIDALLVPAHHAAVLRGPSPPAARVEAEHLAGRHLEA